jgi:hypothetical protein
MLRTLAALLATGALCACGDDAVAPPDAPPDEPATDGGGQASEAGEDGGKTPRLEPWVPGEVLPSPTGPTARGLLDLRGLIHEHSVHSHDACDEKPRLPDGGVDLQCLEDFRAGMCASKHDFIMLTDHDTFFAMEEFPDTLLYDASRGDALVERDGIAVANRAGCPDAPPVLITAGCECGHTMHVGMDGHIADRSLYAPATTEAIEAVKATGGGVSLVSHTEAWTVDQLATLPIDGFEMYNIHANLLLDVTRAIGIIAKANDPDALLHPDLVIMPMVTEDPRYVDTWGQVLARGVKRVTTMGTDAHRNSLPLKLPDGERVDSWRRLNIWFSNHLLVEPETDGTWDDRHTEAALREGRLYGVFEYLGYADGFDFRADAGSDTHEMGAEVPLAENPELRVTAPTVRGLDPDAEPPELTVRLLRATDAGWDEVATGAGSIAFAPTQAGAYRAEVRMRPKHLRAHLNDFEALADEDFVWIYANAIYVAE